MSQSLGSIPPAHAPAAALGDALKTVPGLLRARAALTPSERALWELDATGVWQSISWSAFLDAGEDASRGLSALGIQRGDRIGLIAASSPRWDIAQYAVMAAGGVVVGLDPHDTPQRLADMAERSGLVGLIAEDEATLARVATQRGGAWRFAVTLTAPSSPGVHAFSALGSLYAKGRTSNNASFTADDSALIVFTSGTTGEPKAIAYTHRQVCAAVDSILSAFADIGAGSRLACWLPLSNLFQRVINLCAIGRGAQIFYVADPRRVMDHVASISPDLFIGVPRFFEKLYAGIVNAVEGAPAWQRRVSTWAIEAGNRRARAERAGRRLGYADRWAAAVADRLVLRRIRAVLGDRIRFLVSGSAPMPGWLLERFHALGLLVLEAYGMSESIVPVALNRPDAYRFGSVGRPASGSEVRLADDGELLVRGPGVSAGYLSHGAPGRREDTGGFLASGDFASIDDSGFITLLGRKSEVFKTSTGRRIAPAAVESQLRRLPYVEHAVVFGANRAVLVAVFAVSGEAMRNRFASDGSAIDVDAMAMAMRTDVAAVVGELPDYLRPAGLIVTLTPFSIGTGQITPNLKVRRANVEDGFRSAIDALYDEFGRRTGRDFVTVHELDTVFLMST